MTSTMRSRSATFGLSLAPDQIGSILAVTAVVLGLITRSPGEPGAMRDGYLRGSLPRTPTAGQVDVLAALVATGGSVAGAAEGIGVRPSTAKRHLADLRARSGLTTEQLTYRGRAEGWLVVPSLEAAAASMAVLALPAGPWEHRIRAPIRATGEQTNEIGDGAQADARLNVRWTTPLGEAVVSIA
jgi:hypothetical protein